MFKYIPLTPRDQEAMLKKIGVTSINDLLVDIPASIRLKKPYQIPMRLSESQVRSHLKSLQGQVLNVFRGYGAYEHERPSIIDAIASRQEFLTSYTPYQPEVAQGTLQYIFEFQSMMTMLTGMDVSNASMYDGATALAEATMMAVNQTSLRRIVVASPLFPHTLEVLQTYSQYREVELIILPHNQGVINRQALALALQTPTAAIIVSNPNAYGVIDAYHDVSALAHHQKALVIAYTDAFALARLASPREQGADIACGEAQSLGIPLSYGGPFLGYLTTTNELLRKMPGRICGLTKDNRGQRGFVLTLQTREQHIRREKANSNICSNQSLLALQATIYLATLGKQGFVEAFNNTVKATHYLAQELIASKLFTLTYPKPYAYEVTLTYVKNAYHLEAALIKKGYLSGQVLDPKTMVFYASEMKTKAMIDTFVKLIKEVHHDL
jgi:glycine dehydrogenase subunit 1